MSEQSKHHGTELSTAFLVCGGSEKTREDFLEAGETIAPMIYENDEEAQKDFITGWRNGWEEGTLLLEVLSNDDPSIVECSRLSDRRTIIIERQTFRRARIGIGPEDGLWDGGYVDIWDYNSPESAQKALETWLSEKTAEPNGWIRHRDTGRYRVNGDDALEWFKDDDNLSLIGNIICVVRTKHGSFLQDVSVQENSLHIGSSFPRGSQCFTVASGGVAQWIVYHYHDRSVVLSIDEMKTTSVANVIERLKGGKDN